MADHASRLLNALNKSKVRDRALLESRLPWYYVRNIKVDPPFAHFLSDDEIQACADWFTDTTDDPFIGDSGFIAISMVSELILANQIEQVIQLGHYAGFGSMIIGFILKKVSPDARLISFDIDARMNAFCDRLMERTGLQDIVRHVCIDSTDPMTAELAGLHLQAGPGLIFIDASKQYRNTITEVTMWSQYINGYVISHDVSIVAKGDQANGVLGVSDGLIDSKCFAEHELFILDPHTEEEAGFPYLDPCGLGVAITRGKKKLPKPDQSIDELTPKRRILEPSKLDEAENWFLEEGYSFAPGRLSKRPGDKDAWASCFAPVESRQKLRCEVLLSDTQGSSVMICAGGIPGTSVVFTGDGLHVGEFEAGADNSLVGIFAGAASQFVIEKLRVSPIL